MTARIIVDEISAQRVVRVEGHLTSSEIEALRDVLGDDWTKTVLELGELRSADAAGVRLLRQLRAAGMTFRGVPPRLAFDLDD